MAFIRVGAVGIESGKYRRYFPDSGREEKAIPPPSDLVLLPSQTLLFRQHF